MSAHNITYSIIVIAAMAYVFYFEPKARKAKETAAFDNRTLAFIDGLFFADIPFRCTASQMRSYVKTRLEAAHKLPDTEFLIEHTTARGYTHRSHLGQRDYMSFAILCVAEYAKTYGNEELLLWAESKMRDAERESTRF